MISNGMLPQLDRLSLVSTKRQPLPLHGERRSNARGSSVEFVDYRGYASGDDLRRVDWNLYGRSGQLFVKQFEDERALVVHILVDASLSMDVGEPNKLELARALAGALGYVALSCAGRVTVARLRTDAEVVFGPAQGKNRAAALLTSVGTVRAAGQTDLDRAVTSFVSRERTPGLTILISDLLGPTWETGIRRLLSHESEVVVVHVLAPDELAPEPAEEVRLIDRETGRSVEVRLDRTAIDRYRERLGRWLGAVEMLCGRSKIRYARVLSSTPVAEALLGHLTRAGVVR